MRADDASEDQSQSEGDRLTAASCWWSVRRHGRRHCLPRSGCPHGRSHAFGSGPAPSGTTLATGLSLNYYPVGLSQYTTQVHCFQPVVCPATAGV